MLKWLIKEDLKKAVKAAGFGEVDIVCSISENPKFGDYTANVALQLSKQSSSVSHQSSSEIANAILEKLGHPKYLEQIEVAGAGFINFFIKSDVLAEELKELIYEKEYYGRSKEKVGKKIQVEFVSANPTGPLTLANGRGGALGDTLANVLSTQGYEVEREYYVNDTGNQVRTLGESVLASAGKIAPEDNHYQGDYIKEMVSIFQDKLDLDPQKLGNQIAEYLLDKEIKPALIKFGLKFDNFFSERSLYPKKIEEAADILSDKGVTYEKDGALWFKATEFGDEKDRVLITSDEGRGRSEPTYFLADIAYHLDVYKRGFDKKINLWGADHAGYVKRMQSAVEALTGRDDALNILVFQMVKLIKGGKEVRMSKRAGTYVTIDELLAEVSADAARFFFLMYSPNTHIEFNLDLAKEQSSKNPVYYVQYAYARMSSILSKGALMDVEVDYSLLRETPERELMKQLYEFPDLLVNIATTYDVHKLTTYSSRLADLFHKFYELCPVLYNSDTKLIAARLQLVLATKIVLGNSLDLMGISAPEQM